MKQISNLSIVKLTTWDVNNSFEVAMVHDMGINPEYAKYVTDSDRIYGSARTLFLRSDTGCYQIEDKKYANPIMLDNGELVQLTSNNRIYKVICTGHNGKFEYYQDILHFELVK